ncbi:MAG: DUF2089 domain-containing protein [Sedimentisphaerales bacterium]|nr:DUF2089 domain-containing protein [Sedimentisphaerales bacterium]
MNNKKQQLNLPAGCPLCGEVIEVTQIKCTGCASEITGSFKTEGMSTLPAEYQKFIIVFLRHRGNIKAVEKELGISYPTINKMLDSINAMLNATVTIKEKPLTRKEILDSIERGEMSVKDATFILKTRK